jgi:excisionase family DNA binding protein
MAEPEALVCKPAEVARALQKGRNWVYEAVARGELPALRLGNSIRIPKAAVDRMLEGKGGDAGST